jgi:hypothetical protein
MYNTLTRVACAERRREVMAISERAETKIANFRKAPATLGYVQKNWDDDARRGWFRHHVVLAKMFAIQINHVVGLRRGPPPKPAFQIAIEHYRKPFLKWRQLDLYRRFDKEALEKRRYLFVALHKDPEQALNYQAPFWSSQVNTIAVLSALLPAGYSLLVREHRLNAGRRPTAFYRRLGQLPGVVLVDPFDSQFKYIANADLVVTDNGSTGWEALMLGRRVMTVAPHFFEGAGLDRRVRDVDKIAATVIEMLNAPAIENQKLYDQKLGWLLDAEWETTTPMDPIDRLEMFALLESVLTDASMRQEANRSSSSA